MEEIGWRRIKDKNDDNFKLKWCETKSAINYGSFKEGEYMECLATLSCLPIDKAAKSFSELLCTALYKFTNAMHYSAYNAYASYLLQLCQILIQLLKSSAKHE